MRNNILLLILGITLLQPAFAATRDFASIDSDSNGYISASEANSMPGLSGLFLAIDTDRDGKISPAEYDIAIRGGATSKGWSDTDG